jgi:1-pyrroline-5-carboxylate dehydrogenase
VADRISDSIFDLSAMMSFEMGKNRLEALGDVEETADLLRYYAFQMREHKGFVRKMGSLSQNETNTDVLKPYGVWVVIAPFNSASLAGGCVSAALATGNTVVLKPSSDAPYTSYKLVEYFIEEGVPDGTVNLIVGPGSSAGAELIENKDVAGITFTGSYDIGFKQVYQKFAPDHPKPVVVEMGGKNPTIVSDKADVDKAAQGVMRSAFGLGGRNAQPAHVSTFTRMSTTRFSTSLWRRPARSRLATRRRTAAYSSARWSTRALMRTTNASSTRRARTARSSSAETR